LHRPLEPKQYTSIAFTQRLIAHGVDASVGSVGDAYDNALAESHMGVYKSELIHSYGPWKDRDHLEAATLDWVHWFNTSRPHESIQDLTPIQAEQTHYTHRTRLAEAG
jgi:putative transposase